ncbi:hypothetical protein AB0H37_41940 [Actinomadura sp. NPDC023710]|uniref:hypothetical protein n=1 Tax=Actinomadura sp. NPDC023710 TaxID=3158219 RepID=UPI0033C5A354
MIARRPIGAFAVLRAPRSTAALERLVALSWTSFALAFEPPPARTTLVAIIATALERTILRPSLGATLTLAATPLESTWAPFPARPAATLARARRTVVRGTAAFLAFAALTREPAFLALTARPRETTFATLATLPGGTAAFLAFAARTGEPAFLALTARPRETAFATLAALTGEPAFLALTARPGETAFATLAALT